MNDVRFLGGGEIKVVDFSMRGENSRCPDFVPDPPILSRTARTYFLAVDINSLHLTSMRNL